MTFPGFGDAVVDFYEGLEADNTKAYWTDHKAVYDEQVRAPMVALLADLSAEFGGGKVFRPYRDVRFAADKTPYKTQCGATAGPHYVQVSADGLMVAGGYYRMTSAQVARYRAAVDDERHGPALEEIVESLRKAAAAFRDNDVRYCLSGSVASWARGGPETVNDVDLTEGTFEKGLNNVVKDNDMNFPPEWRLSRSGRKKP